MKINKKGFTLVELLAVIIVLAIIMMIAVQSALPLVTQARTGAFASTGNILMNTVETVVIADEINGYKYDCYSIKYLVEKGYITKVKAADSVTASVGHIGYVQVVRTTAGAGTGSYSYNLVLKDLANGFIFNETNVTEDITASLIKTTDAPSYICPTGSGHNPAGS